MPEYVKQRIAESERAASGADAVTYAETGRAVATATAFTRSISSYNSATGGWTYRVFGRGEAVFTGGATKEKWTRSGVGVSERVASGTSAEEHRRTGLGASPRTASGERRYEARKPGTGRLVATIGPTLKASYNDATGGWTYAIARTKQGKLKGLGEDASTRGKSGRSVAVFTASGGKQREAHKPGTGKSPFSAIGVRRYETYKTGAGNTPLSGFGRAWEARIVSINSANGAIPVYPLVTITGACTNPWIGNVDTGAEMQFDGITLQAGDVMTIDADAQEVLLNAGRVFNYSGAFFPIISVTSFLGGAEWRGAGFTMSVTVPIVERGMVLAPVRLGTGIAERAGGGTTAKTVSRTGAGVATGAGGGMPNGKGHSEMPHTASGTKELSTVG